MRRSRRPRPPVPQAPADRAGTPPRGTRAPGAAYDLVPTRARGRTGMNGVAAGRSRAEREARRRARAYAVRQAVHAERGARRRRDDRIAVGVFALVVGLSIAALAAWSTIGPGAPVAAVTPMPVPSSTASSSPSSSPAPAP